MDRLTVLPDELLSDIVERVHAEFPKNLPNILDPLYNCLRSLSNLKVFSNSLDNLGDSRCTFPGPVLTKIVRARPPSLLHLEIDTESVDRISGYKAASKPIEPANYLCLVISDRVAHLKSLRLRLSCLCTRLFRTISPSTQTTSKLRRAFIRLDNSPGKESYVSVPVEVTDCELLQSSRSGSELRVIAGEPYRGRRNALTLQKIMTHLTDLQEAGAFPQLERFSVWKWHDSSAEEDANSHVRDIATRSIRYYRNWRCDSIIFYQNSGIWSLCT
jgi:hypothetical protein